jgi:hypothetical protein
MGVQLRRTPAMLAVLVAVSEGRAGGSHAQR